MFNIVLVTPQIPQNTGNIIRLSSNTGCTLHLIEPLGFTLQNAKMRRAGLDYHEYSDIRLYQDWPSFIMQIKPDPARVFMLTTRAAHHFSQTNFQKGDLLVFGSESEGLNISVRAFTPEKQHLRLPMRANSRSLNLSNAVAIAVYEAWRQQNFLHGQ